MKRPTIRQALTGLALLSIGGLILYKVKLAPVPVIAHQVATGEIIGEVMGTGTLEARVKTTISPRIQERLVEVLADQGDAVKKDQLLARLDDAEANQQTAIAEATLAAARKTAERVRADLARSEAVLAQARLDAARLGELVVSRAVAQSDADKAVEALGIAEADLKRSNAAIAEADGQVIVAEKNLLYRKEQLAFTRIHAPYDGLVIRRDREPGDVLVPGASLMLMISPAEIWVSTWVDETAMAALAEGQPARIEFRSEAGRSFPGKVSRLGRETDRETREFLVDVGAAELPKNWTIGQRAEVFIETGRQRDAVLLPGVFVVGKGNERGVFVSENGRARWRKIEAGMSGGGNIAVTAGLAAGDVVLRPAEGRKQALAEGQRVAAP
jgi:RND family efflux transporter MFP subunit